MPLLKNGDEWLKNLLNGKKRKGAKAPEAAPAPKSKPSKKKPKAKPPIPKDRPKKAAPGGARPEGPAASMPAAKADTSKAQPKGRKGTKKPAYTKGGNTGDKTAKAEKMSSGGIALNVKRKPKAKLHG